MLQLRGQLLIGCLLLVCSPASGAGEQACTADGSCSGNDLNDFNGVETLNGFDMRGEIVDYVMDTDSGSACHDSCMTVARCEAWVFCAGTRECWLKAHAAGVQANPDMLSGRLTPDHMQRKVIAYDEDTMPPEYAPVEEGDPSDMIGTSTASRRFRADPLEDFPITLMNPLTGSSNFASVSWRAENSDIVKFLRTQYVVGHVLEWEEQDAREEAHGVLHCHPFFKKKTCHKGMPE